jgi:hypothetical protein
MAVRWMHRSGCTDALGAIWRCFWPQTGPSYLRIPVTLLPCRRRDSSRWCARLRSRRSFSLEFEFHSLVATLSCRGTDCLIDAGPIVQHIGLDFSDLEDAAMHLLMILLEWLADRLGPGRLIPAVVPARHNGQRVGSVVAPIGRREHLSSQVYPEPCLHRQWCWPQGVPCWGAHSWGTAMWGERGWGNGFGLGMDRGGVGKTANVGATTLTSWLVSVNWLGCFAQVREDGSRRHCNRLWQRK